MYIHQVAEKSKYFQKPNNKDDHHNKIEDFFDLVVHRNESIDNPQKDSNDYYCN